MKKILFTIYSYSLGGGAEKILSNVVNGLAEKTDYEISVLQYADFGVKTEKTDDRVKILKPVVDMNNSSKAEKIFKYFLVHFCPFILRKRYIKEKYDVEIAFNYQIPSFLTSSGNGVYNVQWNHGDIYDLKKKRFKRYLQKISYKKADKIVSISKNTNASILELFPEFHKKLCTVYNGTKVDAIIEESNKPTVLKLKENSIVFLGRLEPNKNPLKLVKYTERLIKEGFDINLYLLGSGVQEKEIADYIDNAKLTDRIKMLGYVKEPYPIIKQSSAVCMLSENEGFPTVFTEGMALGKPFISSYVGGVEELSDNGKCGIIVNNYEEFRQAVINVVLDTENNNKMENNCNEHIKLFSYDKQISEIINLIEKV
ncbi:MAG: glycosyltransferase [Acutalibacteraceae bacterium]|nr:glycosyltransferase [Acutalibacteraceae bacterium]